MYFLAHERKIPFWPLCCLYFSNYTISSSCDKVVCTGSFHFSDVAPFYLLFPDVESTDQLEVILHGLLEIQLVVVCQKGLLSCLVHLELLAFIFGEFQVITAEADGLRGVGEWFPSSSC